MSTLLSLWTWLVIGILVLAWLPWLIIVRAFDRDPARYNTGRWFRRLGAMMTRANPFWSIHIEGITIDDPRRPYVVVCNHQSSADIPIISRLPWEMKWAAKDDLFRLPVVGWMLSMAGDMPVPPTGNLARARVMIQAQEYLKNNCSVMFFPEGGRTRDGRVLPFTSGAFHLAIRNGAPILPLVIDGTYDALPMHSWRFDTSSDIRLKVLPPVETGGHTTEDSDELSDRVRDQIIAQLAEWRGASVQEVDAVTLMTPDEQRVTTRDETTRNATTPDETTRDAGPTPTATDD